ncbi:MAG: transcriptional regulator [Chloroflexi bacterium]|nr:MAG: transcriptional regulator [Chloroflexota bacterium]
MDRTLRAEVANLHARVCSGLADTNRILLLYVLAEHSHNVTELAALLELPQPTVSRHLKILRECGLVTSQRDGQSVNYALADRRVVEALDLLRAVLADRLAGQVSLARHATEQFSPVDATMEEELS